MYDYKNILKTERSVTPIEVVGEMFKGLVVLALIIVILLLGLSSARAESSIASMMEARIMGVCPEDGPNKLVFATTKDGHVYRVYVNKDVDVTQGQVVILTWSVTRDISLFVKAK